MKKIMIFLICICQIIIVQAQEWMAMQRPLTEAKKSEEFILIPNTVASSPEFLGLVQEMNNTYSTELRKSPSERNLSAVDRIWQRIVGKSIGGMSFSKVFAFDNGRAMVRRTDASKKNYFGFVDGQGNVVVPLEYTSLRNDGRESVYSKISGRFSKQGYIKAQKSVNGKSLYGIIDRNGNVVIDFASKKRMKIAIVPFDEGSQTDPISGMFAKVVDKYMANETKWDEKYQAASDTISSMETELNSLRKFKADTENAAANQEKEKVFAQFEDLVGVEAFDALRDNIEKYSIDELEEKCYAIRGRNGSRAKFSYEQKTPKLAVEKHGTAPEPYGGVFAEYGIVSHNQHN